MRNVLRVATVLASAILAAASATAPTKRAVTTTASVSASFDQAWTATIDMFAERNWAILNLEKDSGLITTDWMSLGPEGDTYADCGTAPLATDVETSVRFNVRIKGDEHESTVSVAATFRRIRRFDGRLRTVTCESMGAVEGLVHREVGMRANSIRKPPAAAEQSPAVRGFYCASSAAAPTSGLCTRQKADCARARGAALVAVPDLTECVLTERASCFDAAPGDERCAPVADGCAAQREREAAAVAPRELNPCVERE